MSTPEETITAMRARLKEISNQDLKRTTEIALLHNQIIFKEAAGKLPRSVQSQVVKLLEELTG